MVSEVQPPNGDDDVQLCDVQVRVPHDELALQVMSHAHDRPQLTLRHDRLPVHATLQVPSPQVRFRQLCAPLHVIAHDLLFVQSIPLRHELSVEHAMLQFQPVGHVMCCVQAALLTMQSILQVLASLLHDVHCDGHAIGCASPFTPESAGITQNPSVQVRPLAHSDCIVHANSSL